MNDTVAENNKTISEAKETQPIVFTQSRLFIAWMFRYM